MSSRYHELYQNYRLAVRALRRIADTSGANGKPNGKWHGVCIGIAKDTLAEIEPEPKAEGRS